MPVVPTMTDLTSKLKAAAEFDPSAANEYGKSVWPTHEDEDSYEFDQKMNWRTGCENGAKWQHEKLRPLLDAMAEVIAMQERALEAIETNINRNIVAGEDVSMEILHYKQHVERARAAARERLKGWVE